MTLKDKVFEKPKHNIYFEEDVKEAVLEFKQLLINETEMNKLFDLSKKERVHRLKQIENQYKKIFGDFEK